MDIHSILPILITAVGIALLVKLRFFFILHPVRCIKSFFGALRARGAKGSLMLSLAGTLGVGNIVGIAYGISVCGAGVVFWLIVSSVFSMIIKYAESALCSYERIGERGGIMFVIKSQFGKFSGIVSKAYALFVLLLSFTMGSSLQMRSAIECIEGGDTVIYVFSALFIAAVTVAVIGGAGRIVGACKYAIPFAMLLYSSMTLGVIFLNINKLPYVIGKIISSAFDFRAVGGGVSIFTFSKTVSEGFKRGLLSNEAGAGTSSIAHSRNTNLSPATVGLFGICEVFFDTVVLCPLTAIAILTVSDSTPLVGTGAEIAKIALSVLGPYASPLLLLCISFFAYSTVVCWFYYGRVAAEYLAPFAERVYPIAFIVSLAFGMFIKTDYLILASDLILFFLSLISICALIKNSDRLVALSEADGFITKRGYGRGAFCRVRKATPEEKTRKSARL